MSSVSEPERPEPSESITAPIRRLWAGLQTSRGLICAASVAGVIACALLLLKQEQISPVSIVLAIVSVGALSATAGRSWKLVCLVAVDLLIVFAYTWSLGESVPFTIVATHHHIKATVDGQTFYEKIYRPQWAARGIWVGLFASPPQGYNTGSVGLANAWGTGLEPALAGTRWSVPRTGWKMSLTLNGHSKPITPADLHTIRGHWYTDPRGEIEGSLTSAALIDKLTAPRFRISGRVYRPDGHQGIIFGIGSPGHGYTLLIRMDHRDARFYHWVHSEVGTTTNSHPSIFPVQTVPMLQRVGEFLLPGFMLAFLLMTLALVAFAVLAPLLSPLERLLRTQLSRIPKLRQLTAYGLDGLGGALAAVGTTAGALLALNDNQTLSTIEDTATYLWQARTFALGRLYAPIPSNLTRAEVMNFFSVPFTFVDTVHHEWYGKYPPGWPALLSLGQLFDKAWMVAPIVGGLGILLIFLIGREVYGPFVALVATALAVASPFILAMSGSFLSQSATWLWCGLFAYLVIFWFRRRPEREPFSLAVPKEYWFCLVGAGLAIGLGFATRQLDSLTLAIPFLVLFVRRPLAVLWVGAGALLPLILLALYNAAVVQNPLASGYGTVFSWDRLGFGPHVGGPTAYERDFTFARALWNFAYDLQHIQGGMLGWPFLFGIAIPALAFLLGRVKSWDWLFLASTLCVMGAYMAYWASGVTGGFPRYWFVTVPWLILLTARGFEELYRFPGRLLGLSTSHWLPAILFPAALFAVLMNFDVQLYLPKNNLNFRNPGGEQVAAVKRAHLHHAILFQQQYNSENSEYDWVFGLNSPLLNSNIVWAVDHGAADAKIMHAMPHWNYYRINGTVITRLRRPNPKS